MSQYFENKNLKEILEKKRSITAEEMVIALDIKYTQDDRKIIFQKVRKAMRQVVDMADGKRENRNKKGELVYEL